MTTAAGSTRAYEDAVEAAIEVAVGHIAPTWPLDRMIAVNPYWGYIDQPFDEAARALGRLAGSPMTMTADWYRNAWQSGEITAEALDLARAECSPAPASGDLIAALQTSGARPAPAPLLADSLDHHRDLTHEPAWCDIITHQIAQYCAAHFDHDQSDWRPDPAQSLYAGWRSVLSHDHSVALLMKAPSIPARAARLAADPRQQIRQALARLEVPEAAMPDYLQAVMMRISGWAAWGAYLRWQARLAGDDDTTLVDLLAIRLSWECLLDDGNRHPGSVWGQWQTAWRRHEQAPEATRLRLLRVWQRAQEISYQQALFSRLSHPAGVQSASRPAVQAAFCIDVRSEVLRRHLEAQSAEIQTLGFAGFFGLPIRYQPLGTDASRPQLPGLLSPAMTVTDSTGDADEDSAIAQQRQTRLQGSRGWARFQSVPLSAFVLVESLGLGYLGKLVRQTLPSTAPPGNDSHLGLTPAQASALGPRLTATDTAEQAQLAHQILTAMGLTGTFARLVLLLGHGSQTRNNPHRAGLDCGACCGQRGDINARTLAHLLNDAAIRSRLGDAGIDIPDDTRFVAGLHNTTTDQVELFDAETLPDSHAADLARLQAQLEGARREAARERAPALGLAALQDQPAALARALGERANDWSQTRPEWALANNAAFIVAPRARTRGLNLAGRCFLHDYDHRQDPNGTLLEQIMTAPMVVAHWINMQYYASTVDNPRFGSGNKTLHNVVGGRLGVFEGNGGDLRIGLPLQSVHNGDDWHHTPLRLTVVIEAPRHAIEAVIGQHETVRHLVDNQWLYIARLEAGQVEHYRRGQWQTSPGNPPEPDANGTGTRH